MINQGRGIQRQLGGPNEGDGDANDQPKQGLSKDEPGDGALDGELLREYSEDGACQGHDGDEGEQGAPAQSAVRFGIGSVRTGPHADADHLRGQDGGVGLGCVGGILEDGALEEGLGPAIGTVGGETGGRGGGNVINCLETREAERGGEGEGEEQAESGQASFCSFRETGTLRGLLWLCGGWVRVG